MTAALRRLLRDPLMLFLLIGGGIFAGYALVTRHGERIEVTRAMQASLAEDYALLNGRPPDAAARGRLVRDYVADEILFREAIARGLHLTDRATRRRLTDRLRYAIGGAPAEPTEEALVNFYAEHLDRYRTEPQVSFTQVFFAAPPADPAAILARLNRGERVAGDDFWMGRTFPDYGRSMVRGLFGVDVLAVLEQARPGRWYGPVRSGRGVHFVRLGRRRPAALLPYLAARDQVRQDYTNAVTGRRIAAEVARLGRDYDVTIDR